MYRLLCCESRLQDHGFAANTLAYIISAFDAAYAMVLVYKSRQEMSSSLFEKQLKNHKERIRTMDKQPCVYILRCCDSSLYTGWTNDIEKRLFAHNSGCGAKYTRGRRPVTLVYLEELPDKSSALRREAAIKKMKRSQKEALIQTFSQSCSRNLP